MVSSEQMGIAVQDLLQDLSTGELALFVGAGVSAGALSGLPLWAPFRDHLLETISGRAENDMKIQRRWDLDLLRKKPEAILEVILDVTGEAGLFSLLTAFRGHTTNPNHRWIASLCYSGLVSCIVTTNFDTLIETALTERGFIEIPIMSISDRAVTDQKSYTVVASPEEWGHPNVLTVISQAISPVMILKVHGTLGAVNSQHRGIIATLRAAAIPLSHAKRNVLDRILRRFSVLVAGYSGNDQDLLPYLLSRHARSRRLYWNFSPSHSSLVTGPGQLVLSAYGSSAASVSFDLASYAGDNLFALLSKEVGIPVPLSASTAERETREVPELSHWTAVVERWCAKQPAHCVYELWGGFLSMMGNRTEASEVYREAVRHATNASVSANELLRLNFKAGREGVEPLILGSGPSEINLVESLKYLRRAAALAHEHAERTLEAETELFLAAVTQLADPADSPRAHLTRAFALAFQSKNEVVLLRWHLFMANDVGMLVSGRSQYFSETAKHLDEVLRLAERTGDLRLAAVACRQLGRGRLWDTGQLRGVLATQLPSPSAEMAEDIRRLFFRSKEICHEIGDLEGLIDTLNNECELYRALDRKEEFEIARREAIALRAKLGDSASQARSLFELAVDDLATGEEELGQSRVERALELWSEAMTLKSVDRNDLEFVGNDLLDRGCDRSEIWKDADHSWACLTVAERIFAFLKDRSRLRHLLEAKALIGPIKTVVWHIGRDLTPGEIERVKQVGGPACAVISPRRVETRGRGPRVGLDLMELSMQEFRMAPSRFEKLES